MRWIKMMDTEHEVSSIRLVRRWQPMSEKDAFSIPIHLGYHFQWGKSILAGEVPNRGREDLGIFDFRLAIFDFWDLASGIWYLVSGISHSLS